MNISGIDDALQRVADVMIHQLNRLQLLIRPFLIAAMRKFDYKYERAGEHCQQDLIDESHLRVKPAGRHPQAN